jgi:hypothetical protein
MTSHLWAIATVVVLPGVVALGVTSARASRAHHRAHIAVGTVHSLGDGAHELASLRGSVPSWARDAQPAAGLTQAVTAVLEKCGLKSTVLETLAADPEPESARVAAPTIHRRGASLVLSNLTLPQLGAFLAAWREREPRWTVARVDLSPVPRKDEGGLGADAGGDLPVRAVLGLECLTVLSGTGERP